MTEIKVLHSLHRPYHCPLWIVKWICYFYAKRSQSPNGYFLFKDFSVDMYFKMLEWLKKYYPIKSVGVPSEDAICSVLKYFELLPLDKRALTLRDILAKSKRETGVETQIYSTYKAVSYYHNLAKEKLHFVDDNRILNYWNYRVFRIFRFNSCIAKGDRNIILYQILRYDGHFFLSQVLLYKHINKYNLKAEDIVFDFMQRFYPIPRFDFVSRSRQNYYVVRKHWIEQLGIVSDSGKLSTVLRNTINSDCILCELEKDISNNIKKYIDDIRIKSGFIKNISLFYASYRKILKRQNDISEFVNLYDICSEMKMSYARFNTFLDNFYEAERTKKNIFFINIVSTIDQRKRFYVRETPVLKIKIS